MVTEAFGILETTGFTPAMVAMDVMDKTSGTQVLQAEINDFLGICIKVSGTPAALDVALKAGFDVAQQMGGRPVMDIIRRPNEQAWRVIDGPSEYNPLIQQAVVRRPAASPTSVEIGPENIVSKTTAFALGFIETQGFTAVFEAIDTACKAANVEVIGKEKLGGGYVTVVIKGDVAAVKAAIDAGSGKVEGLGTLIASHVIARPSESVLGLLPSL